MKQTNYKKLDLLYQDNYGRFYQAGETSKKPMVFNDGQMDLKIQYVIVYGLLSDGVVVIDEEYLKNNGIQYLVDNNYAYFNMNKDNIAKDYQLLLKRK